MFLIVFILSYVCGTVVHVDRCGSLTAPIQTFPFGEFLLLALRYARYAVFYYRLYYITYNKKQCNARNACNAGQQAECAVIENFDQRKLGKKYEHL